MKKRLNRKGWVLLGSLILIVTVLGAAGLLLGRYYWATAVGRSGVVYVPTVTRYCATKRLLPVWHAVTGLIRH